MHFNLKIHAKKGKNGKKKAHLFGIHINSYKKRQKCKKKAKKNFQIAKILMQKKSRK